MTKRDIVGYLDISMKTLYNWEKERPNLYKTIMKGLAFDDIVELNKASYEKAKEMGEMFGKQNILNIKNLIKITDILEANLLSYTLKNN